MIYYSKEEKKKIQRRLSFEDEGLEGGLYH